MDSAAVGDFASAPVVDVQSSVRCTNTEPVPASSVSMLDILDRLKDPSSFLEGFPQYDNINNNDENRPINGPDLGNAVIMNSNKSIPPERIPVDSQDGSHSSIKYDGSGSTLRIDNKVDPLSLEIGEFPEDFDTAFSLLQNMPAFDFNFSPDYNRTDQKNEGSTRVFAETQYNDNSVSEIPKQINGFSGEQLTVSSNSFSPAKECSNTVTKSDHKLKPNPNFGLNSSSGLFNQAESMAFSSFLDKLALDSNFLFDPKLSDDLFDSKSFNTNDNGFNTIPGNHNKLTDSRLSQSIYYNEQQHLNQSDQLSTNDVPALKSIQSILQLPRLSVDSTIGNLPSEYTVNNNLQAPNHVFSLISPTNTSPRGSLASNNYPASNIQAGLAQKPLQFGTDSSFHFGRFRSNSTGGPSSKSQVLKSSDNNMSNGVPIASLASASSSSSSSTSVSPSQAPIPSSSTSSGPVTPSSTIAAISSAPSSQHASSGPSYIKSELGIHNTTDNQLGTPSTILNLAPFSPYAPDLNSNSGHTPASTSASISKPVIPGPRKRGRRKENLTDDQKRINHIHSEKRRRDLIKSKFEQMCGLVPKLSQSGSGFNSIPGPVGTNGISKSMILGVVYEYIVSMIERNEKLRALCVQDGVSCDHIPKAVDQILPESDEDENQSSNNCGPKESSHKNAINKKRKVIKVEHKDASIEACV
ncbi:hypothetical protein NADFUDRAFT_41286 [Nadsonia fulvescens var. elongata DSM 6958]|uniref:BHLH domain-containing protein n=1 Tax=Nadsonia fulvescens var. elongata DSM 6958 TaxID=857566 RepID=A0A1E3PML0_9ASCO|nr:hypothetical protein NADFUDRAFT_41286 [Nadsonia fulvescens var. elongata DSM 6958]